VEPQEDEATAFSGQSLTANVCCVQAWWVVVEKKIGDSLEFAQTLRSVAEKRGDYK